MTDIELNLTASLRNLADDRDLMQSIGQIVIEDLPSLLENLCSAATRDDRSAVRHAAHAIKGLAANFSAQPLIHLATQLESGFQLLESKQSAELADEIREVGQETVVTLRTALDIAE